METEEAIVIEEQNVHVTLYFTPKSTWWASQPTSEEIRRTFNNHAHRMFIEARVQISEALGNYIRSGSREVGSLADEYEALGRTLEEVIKNRVNRLIGYARSVKGQFWLEELERDLNPTQFFIRSEGKASLDDTPVSFHPDHEVKVTVGMPSAEKMLTPEDWPKLRAFAIGDSRPPLIGSLLANARSLGAQRNRRNALVEAVTALEVALSAFARKADPNTLVQAKPRLETEGLKALVEKVGLRGSFNVVIPILFTEAEFPISLLKS